MVAHRYAAAGLGAIVVAKIAVRLAPMFLSKVGAGVVAATVPVAGWTIGLGLVVTDVVVNRHGALGIAKKILMEPETKKEMMNQLRSTITAELSRHTAVTAAAVAKDTYNLFLEFARQWKRVLYWSEENAYFRRFLDLVRVDELAKLADLVGVLESQLDVDGMNKTIDNGDLEKLFDLPQESYIIIAAVEDPRQLIEWADLAGNTTILLKVVESDIFRVSDPRQFENRRHLERVLNLNLSQKDLRRVTLLEFEHAEILLNLSRRESKDIVELASQNDDLVWLLPFLSEVSRRQANQTIDRILAHPELLRKLDSKSVRKALKSSPDFAEYLNLMLEPPGQSIGDRALQTVEEIDGVLAGRISRESFYLKYRGHMVSVLVFAAIAFLWKIGKWRREAVRSIRRGGATAGAGH